MVTLRCWAVWQVGQRSRAAAQRLARRRAVRLGLLGAALLPLVACGGFFQCENKPACPTTTGPGTTPGSAALDVAYVSYTTAAGNAVVTGYSLTGGALSAINSVTLPFVPIAMAVTAKNTFLYVASVPGYSSPGIYAYAIGTDGSLTVAFGGKAVATDQVGAMAIAPDGNYLYTLESLGQEMLQYAVNESTGALATGGPVAVQALSCAPSLGTPLLPSCAVAVSPKGDFVVASLGTQGDAVYSYNSASGVTSNGPVAQLPPGTNSGDFAVAIDANDNAYVAQTSTMTRFGLATTGVTNLGYYGYPSGQNPRSIVVDPGSKFVYTADVKAGKITGFAAGTTTTLTGSPYAAPANVAALGVDNTDTYLVAVGYDATAGVQLYSLASSGVLSALAKTAGTSTITQNPVLLAMTH